MSLSCKPLSRQTLSSISKYLQNKNLHFNPSEDIIESGSYSNVYRIHDGPNASSPVVLAAKVINRKLTSPNYWYNHLPMEVYVTIHLKHPNIIRFHSIARLHLSTVVILMEYAPYNNIASVLETTGHYGEAAARQLFAPVLSALGYMHGKRFVHRDLKVENLLLTQPTAAKIADFSFAMVINLEKPLSSVFCGSLPYFSPQILSKTEHHPMAADVWALGVCLFVMLSNAVPFNPVDEAVALQKQLNCQWDFKPRVAGQISAECKSFLKRIFEPDEMKRATVEALLQDPWLKAPSTTGGGANHHFA